MIALQLERPGGGLVSKELPDPEPGPLDIRIAVAACGVCRTDLHILDGDLPGAVFPITPGHEIVGVVDRIGSAVEAHRIGDRVGVGWLGGVCEVCAYCRKSQENLCDRPTFTGYTRPGGFATHVLADARFAYRLPADGDATEVAPLMCAGLIGWRSLTFAGDAPTIGLYGFGAAAHIILQVAKWQGRRVFVFTRPDDVESQVLATRLGADWAGGADEIPAEPLDAAIIYAPVGALVPSALRAVRKGGRVICAGIHMSDIPSFPYAILWGERSIRSVANLTRQDAEDFLALAPQVPIKTVVQKFPMPKAMDALQALRRGRIQGAAVLVNET